MYIIISAIFLLASLKWGDWKNWETYYPTVLFFALGDLIYNSLIVPIKPMWIFSASFDSLILPNHGVISLFLIIGTYPTTIVMFFKNFPQTIGKRILRIVTWSIIYIVIEFLHSNVFSTIKQMNGWTLGWSFLFDIMMFSLFAIHLKSPIRAWSISTFVIIILIMLFDINLRDWDAINQ